MGNRDWFITLKTQKCLQLLLFHRKKTTKETCAHLCQSMAKKHIKYQSSSYFDPTSTSKMLDR